MAKSPPAEENKDTFPRATGFPAMVVTVPLMLRPVSAAKAGSGHDAPVSIFQFILRQPWVSNK
ncbi:hypothetical protein D9M68_810160 [compost metagenome]